MNREETIKEYYKIYLDEPKRARELVKKLKYIDDHLLLQKIAQTYLDEARFTSSGEEKSPIDRRKLRYAETYAVKAFKMRPICSNVLWTLAQIRIEYGQDDSAIFCLHEIIRLGVKGISNDSCKNKLSKILAQINDSKFELYRLYYKKNPQLSKRYLTLYKKGLEKGINSLYQPLEKFLLPEKNPMRSVSSNLIFQKKLSMSEFNRFSFPPPFPCPNQKP
jgi:hypothetical protein